MSNYVRCTETNTSIGEYYVIFMALRDHLNQIKQEDQLVKYLHEFGIMLYPDIMQMISAKRFIDADNIYKPPLK
jgi:hypothetical protein